MITTGAQVSGLPATPGHSYCNISADNNVKKMEEEENGDSSQVPGSKRMLSTEDPDYTRPPDAKRMREMHKRAQDELSERVIKVVDKEFSFALNEKQAEMEEIDNRILRLQQCLHTLRYCVSLNYYAVNKTGEVGKKHKAMLHPAVRKHLGKSTVKRETVEPPLHESLQNISPSHNLSAITSRLPQGEYRDSVGVATIKEEPVKDSFSGNEDVSNSILETHNTVNNPSKDGSDRNDEKNQDLKSSRPPSPKYLPPKPPDNPLPIFQGRHQRFQSKRRVIVGNTYQYITAHADESNAEVLRYKWQVYVRAPLQGEDISSFISAVTFVLDHSYAPHHIITLKHPPFVLTRRGWGEFKIHIVLKFTDTRNKQVKLLHPLVLSRPDDPLSLTGLWRLGQENWYDLWVYELDPESSRNIAESPQVKERTVQQEDCPATLARELKTNVVSSQIEENITIVHNVDNINLNRCIKQETPVKKEKEWKVLCSSEKNNCVSEKVNESVVANKLYLSTDPHCFVSNDTTLTKSKDDTRQTISAIEPKIKVDGTEENKTQELKPLKNQMGVKLTNINGVQSKVCKIHVRQPDGRLVPYYIPAHMYSLALKIAQSGTNKQENNKSAPDNKQENQQEVIGHQNINQRIIKVHVPENQQKGETKSIIVKQEPSEFLAQQKEDPKVATLEVKTELNHNTNACGAPIRILNFSPQKKVIINNEESISLMPSTSGIKSVPKPALITQPKQTVTRLSSGRLSQSPLQQLLVKAVQDKKHALVQQLLSKKRLKDGSVDILQNLQGQITYTQTPVGLKSNIQIMPLKLVKDMQTTINTSNKIIQRPVSATNIRFITNNGQLVSAGKHKSKTTSPSSKVVTSIATCSGSSSSNCVITSTTSITQASSSTPCMMIQGQQATGSSGLQQGMSKRKTAMTRPSPLVVRSNAVEAGTVLQIPPFVVRGVGNSGTLKTISNSVKSASATSDVTVAGVSLLRGSIVTATPTTVCSLLKPFTLNTSAEVTSASPIITNVLTRVTSNTPIKNISVNASSSDKVKIAAVKVEKTSEEPVNKDVANSASQEWEERVRELEAVCKRCSSADVCVYIWVRALPLVASHYECSRVLPFCARSRDEFLHWPLGKQRAAEFHRAREVKRHLHQCQVDGSERWSVNKIVAWARRHAHTPISSRQLLLTDMLFPSVITKPEKTLSHLGSLEKLVQDNDQMTPKGQSGLQDIDVVTFEDKRKVLPRCKLTALQKFPVDFLPWEDVETASGCEWVRHLTSQLRLNLAPEEVAAGYTADAACATLWKAVLRLMEDLLRSSHSQAWGDTMQSATETSVVPPQDITLHHVLRALTNSRQEYDIFTDYGLGAPAETTTMNTA